MSMIYYTRFTLYMRNFFPALNVLSFFFLYIYYNIENVPFVYIFVNVYLTVAGRRAAAICTVAVGRGGGDGRRIGRLERRVPVLRHIRAPDLNEEMQSSNISS